MLKLMVFLLSMCSAVFECSAEIQFVFDNASASKIILCSVAGKEGINAITDSEIGRRVVKFDDQESIVHPEIHVNSKTEDAYFFEIDNRPEFYGKKLFEIKDESGSVLASLKMVEGGKIVLCEQSTKVMIGLYIHTSGMHKLIIADDSNTFVPLVGELFKSIQGMPPQWVPSI